MTNESEKLVQALAMWRDPRPVIEGPALRFTSTEHGRAALLTLHPDSERIDALTDRQCWGVLGAVLYSYPGVLVSLDVLDAGAVAWFSEGARLRGSSSQWRPNLAGCVAFISATTSVTRVGSRLGRDAERWEA